MKKNKGFTLLELLVVIGIIALLVSVATVSYSAAQLRTRDARRKADLNAMKDALEQYYSANGFAYPATCGTAATDFLKGSWPVDPGTYTYKESCVAGPPTTYCICAKLEVVTAGNSSSDACTWTSNPAGSTHYCVGNLQ